MYRTTPHTTTSISPAQMLFYHIPNNGLPTIQPSKSTATNRETNYREQIKKYIDKKRFTKHKDFQIGEKVLVKQPKTKSKMDSFYEQHPYTITENYKNSLRIKDTKGMVHIRNKALVKQYFQKPANISSSTQRIIEINHNDMGNDFITLFIEELYETNNKDADKTKSTKSDETTPYMPDSDQESNCNEDFSAGTTDSVDQQRS